MAKKNKIKNWVIPGVVGGVVIILTVASIVSGSIQQKKEKESNAASVSVDRIKLKDDSATGAAAFRIYNKQRKD